MEEDKESAARDLARIRALMERAGRFSHLSGVAAIGAGLLAAAGVGASRLLQADYAQPSHASALAGVWGGVLLLAAAQAVGFTVLNARRRAEPAWNPLSQKVVQAMLPAVFTGAAVTGYGLQTGQLDLLPPVWMLAYGSSLLGLGLYAGLKINLAGAAFLALGAATLWWWKDHGLSMLLVSFGGIHILLGAWILWKPRE